MESVILAKVLLVITLFEAGVIIVNHYEINDLKKKIKLAGLLLGALDGVMECSMEMFVKLYDEKAKLKRELFEKKVKDSLPEGTNADAIEQTIREVCGQCSKN